MFLNGMRWPVTFLVRAACAGDLDGLLALARHLDTVNLPYDARVLAELIARSEASFAAKIERQDRVFVCVLEEPSTGRIVGSSTVFAQHGTRKSPHVYFDVRDEERYSETLDRHLCHRVLRIGYDYDGPTEIGGLILLPELRSTPHKLGLLLSFARFVLIGTRRDVFRDQVLAELLPPLEPDGTSLLWEHLGRRFTAMSYPMADRLSQKNKEFIRALFPQEPLYVTMLPPDAQALIGTVGPLALGVERMLRSIGFAYAKRIDPFDGGPHFIANTDDISLVRSRRDARVLAVDAADPRWPSGLIATGRARAGDYRACWSPYRFEDGEVALPAAARKTLALSASEMVSVQPV
jgi:arginine N-succinyltransferase